MHIKSHFTNIINRARVNATNLIVLLNLTISLLFLVRFAEVALMSIKGNDSLSIACYLSALTNDITLALILILPFLLSSLLLGSSFKKVCGSYIFIFVLLDCGLTQFYLTSGYLLSSVIFQMNTLELAHLLINEFSDSRILYFGSFLAITGVSAFLLFTKTDKSKLKVKHVVFLLLVPIIIFGHFTQPNDNGSKGSTCNFSQNKVIYFASTLCSKTREITNDSNQILEYIAQFHQARQGFTSYVSDTIPFLHYTPYRNVLGEYFPKSTTPPNVVVLIVESLSTFFCGDNAAHNNLMPFTKSLIDSSLYWPNFLSNCPQTFGVLPNILGSLPYGNIERGFINMDNYPEHTSIVSLLNSNGYNTNFFYAGWLPFDNTDRFVTYCKFNNIFSNNDTLIRKRALRISTQKPDNKWGLNETELFNTFFKNKNTFSSSPHFTTMLTLTLHSPFNMCPDYYYNPKFIEQRCIEQGISLEAKQEIPDKILSSILFVDDALRLFFEKYHNIDGFDNTIFIITGDHGCWELNYRNALQRFQVPLIVYSPMLRSHKKFRAISTHRDITPTLLALLQGNFGLSFPAIKQWTGAGLDTCSQFRSRTIDALSLYLPGFPSFIWNELVLYDQHVYKLDSSLNMEQISSPRIIKQVQAAEKSYKVLNDYVCKQGILTPQTASKTP